MAAAIAMLQGFGQKVAPKEHSEHRILQVNMSSPDPVDIQFSNITLKVPEGILSKKHKTILKGVSGRFKPGELTGIMGPSGAGKSSLLNALTGFCTKGVTGTIRAGDSICDFSNNNKGFSSLKSYRKKSCYILQDDRLNPLFTVSELMHFATDMKIGNGLNDKLKHTVISDILNTLGLSGTEDTLCSKLSGGQRKRLSIAAELIDNPPVIFLDEPTTGLDSLSSAQCIEMLKQLAYGQRTVVCTIHQPSASIYSMFDQVYILAEGMCIYKGTSENTVPHLASVGFHCPMYHNPADYILEIANGEYGNYNDILAKKLPVLQARQDLEKCRQPIVQVPNTRSSVDTFSCGKMSVLVKPPHEFYKFNILLKRCFVQQYRDWTVTHLKLVLHVFVGVLLGLLYHKAGEDGSRTINNMGFLMVSAVYLCYTSLMPSVLKFPSELPVLKKENFNNWYNLRTYYAAVLVTGIPIQIWFSFVYSLSSYFLSGQPPDLIRFGMFVLALAHVTVLSDAIGNVFGTCFNPVNGTFLGAIFVCAMIAFAGFLALIADMHAVMQVVSCVSFVKYGFEAMALAVYANNRPPLLCPDSQLYCHLKYPKEIIKQFSFHYDAYWTNILILITEVIVVRFIAYFTLRRTVRRSS